MGGHGHAAWIATQVITEDGQMKKRIRVLVLSALVATLVIGISALVHQPAEAAPPGIFLRHLMEGDCSDCRQWYYVEEYGTCPLIGCTVTPAMITCYYSTSNCINPL
jgi:hypothetical protein